MSYTPPPPGATEAGKPTPDGVPKQDAHIKDLPPEVRRSFLLSMVFFPSAVGASICLVLFLGWWVLKPQRSPAQYAEDLRNGVAAGSTRVRWEVARDLAENINDPALHDPAILDALLEILAKPDLDEAVEQGATPSMMIRGEDEAKPRLRHWAAPMAGYLAGVLKDPRGLPALVETLNEEDTEDAVGMRVHSAHALGLLKDMDAADALVQRLRNDSDYHVRYYCAKALGSIGYQNYFAEGAPRQPDAALEVVLQSLRDAYNEDAETTVKWNAAIALARLKDDTGRKTLEELRDSTDKEIQANLVLQNMIGKALAILDGKSGK